MIRKLAERLRIFNAELLPGKVQLKYESTDDQPDTVLLNASLFPFYVIGKMIPVKTKTSSYRFLPNKETQKMEKEIKRRYSDDDLNIFKARILEKLTIARQELSDLMASLGSSSLNDGDGNFKTLEDGAATLEKESINQLAARQKKFIL